MPSVFSSSRSVTRLAGLILIVALGTPLLLSLSVAGARPRMADFFEYNYNTYVDQGTDYYFGYSDKMISHARYTVQSVSGDLATVHGLGTWTFDGSDGTHQSGVTDVTPVFSVSTRRYVSGIDVNASANATVWFWVSMPVAQGQTLRILDDVFTVISTDTTVWNGIIPHRTVQLQASGTYTRNDAYGNFVATYTDRYYFDPDSGYVVAESYEERDTNPTASFRFRAEVFVTAGSYSVPLAFVPLALVDVGVPAAAVLAVAALIRVRRGPSRLRIGSKDFPTEVRIRKAKTPADVASLASNGSPFFGPFLPLLAERSVAERDPVVLALADRKLVGLALFDQESAMGSLFASDDAVARVLMKRVKMQHFFADATIPSGLLRAQEIDRFAILQLRNPQPRDYDSTLVRPMSADDLGDVVAIAQSTYRASARRFIASSFQGGDFGYVATANGRVVGFGFATVVGTVARLHTLTVDAPYRAQGIGTQIMNARLSALAALGVDRVILEISRKNIASMRVATRAGFVPLGETVYYSRRPEAAPAAQQRQT
jgi:GNAT superfamily N-acetyltransferase